MTTLGAQTVTIDITPTKTGGAPTDVKVVKVEKVPLEYAVNPTQSPSKPSQSSSQISTTKTERVRVASPTKKGPPPAYEEWQNPQESQERELVSLTVDSEDMGERDREKGVHF